MARRIGWVGRIVYPLVAAILTVPLFVVWLGAATIRLVLDLVALHFWQIIHQILPNSYYPVKSDLHARVAQGCSGGSLDRGATPESRWWLDHISAPHSSARDPSSTAWCSTEFISVGELETVPLIFVIFPGNPGNPGFYVDYMAKLHKTSNSMLACVCVSHLGHSVGSALRRGERYHLLDQIQHKVAVLAHLGHQFPQAQFVVAGHSVGAHCMVEARLSNPCTLFLHSVGANSIVEGSTSVSVFPSLSVDTHSMVKTPLLFSVTLRLKLVI